tara:strand:+ start:66 stop:299 length:234 start_codon:yes stop_codon:yes gene_type:complete
MNDFPTLETVRFFVDADIISHKTSKKIDIKIPPNCLISLQEARLEAERIFMSEILINKKYISNLKVVLELQKNGGKV